MKKQNLWLYIFGAMFLIPEILFFTTISSIINYSGGQFLTLASPFVANSFFINNPQYFALSLILQIVGALGVFIFAIRRHKKFIYIFSGLILIWLVYVSFLAYLSANVIFLM